MNLVLNSKNSSLFKFIEFIIVSLLLINTNCIYAKDWWENGNFYQIYPRSFKDSDGDGIGDLNGITEKLQYLKDIGITGAWLSPIFKSPMADFGYDISDFYQIHPEYGTMADFENLLKKAKEIDIKIFLDFVPNHTSDENEWFKKSVKKEGNYTDFYVWHDGKFNNETKKIDPPSNWLGSFRYSAWEYNSERKQYYLHQFAIKQPDLNYRSAFVKDTMDKVMNFWLSKGIDGFRIDAVPFLFEKENRDTNGSISYPDEPENPDCPDKDDFCHLKHIYTQNQPETIQMVYHWHDLVTQFKINNGGHTKILLTEAYTSLDNIIKMYGDGKRNGSNVPFNFELLSNLNNKTNASGLSDLIDSWFNKMPKDVHANWVLGNHDNKRLASRLGIQRADLFNILLQTLPGIAVTYNGEELAMTDVFVDWKHTVDPQACNANKNNFNDYSRDPARTPFQWDASKNSGFSSGSQTWLPVSDLYKTNNVLNQLRSPVSHIQVFKKLIKLRQEPSFEDGTLENKTVIDDNLLIYKRELKGSDIYVVVLNLGSQEKEIDLTKHIPGLSSKVEVVVTSVQSKLIDGEIADPKKFIAEPYVGTVVVSV